MGGYAVYVWGSFGAAALVLLWNILTPGLERRSVLRRLGEEAENGSGNGND